ncbi:MAG: NAD(+) synthase [Clostridiales bacterium]|jgi:NAD+ synthase (glutamine-hydrolysing)|nr:NAD(+) synthase [Clostridiales bacterium]
MLEHGFARVAALSPALRLADCGYNAGRIIESLRRAAGNGAAVAVFPELCVTGYTCGDLFFQETLIEAARRALRRIVEETGGLPVFACVGLPMRIGGKLYNCAAAFCGGKVLGIIPKNYLPNYGEFYEKRWFFPGRNAGIPPKIFDRGDFAIGVEICEDLWAATPPSTAAALSGARIILNLSASNELSAKEEYRRLIIAAQSAKTYSAYVYANAGAYESTTDAVYGGGCLIYENGALLAESPRFERESEVYADIDLGLLNSERVKNTVFAEAEEEGALREAFEPPEPPAWDGRLLRRIDPTPFVPRDKEGLDARCEEIFSIASAGLCGRLSHTGIKKAVIGVSGGLDSTLALLVASRAFKKLGRPPEDIIGVSMPGFGTTSGTRRSARGLMELLGVTIREIDITEACALHFRDIGQDPETRDVTYENAQARERTQILMDTANKEGGLVIGTGDLSEIALGFSTYNGDHMSMYAVNCGIPKTLIRHLVRWAGERDEAAAPVLRAILETPVSPELLPPGERGEVLQKTEDLIGPYELHDFFLYHMIRYGEGPKKIAFLAERAFPGYDRRTVAKWLTVFVRRFFANQYKRSCMPDGPKVGTVALSPRGDWRMPSDASRELWEEELSALE